MNFWTASVLMAMAASRDVEGLDCKYEIPEVFLSSKKLEIFYKYCPKVLIGKHQLKFPINIPIMFENSPYLQTLLEATDLEDFSKVKMLSDYNITYENEAFVALWNKFNFNGGIVPIDKWNLKTLFEMRTYACYFGFPIVDAIDQQIGQQKDIPYEFHADFGPIYKKWFISHMHKNLEIFNQPRRTEYECQKFETEMFTNFSHMFQPEHKHKLDAVTEIYPKFRLTFVNMVRSCMGKGFNGCCPAMNLWYRENPQLRNLGSKKYHIASWLDLHWMDKKIWQMASGLDDGLGLTCDEAKIPEAFLSPKKWEIAYKYFPKILIGKHQLKFPLNIPLMYEHSPYFRTLLEATEITDFSEVKLLADYDITYENVAFMALWRKFNLDYLDTALDFINDPKALFEILVYINYFGFPVNDKICQQLCQQQDIPCELQEVFAPIYKKWFISYMQKSLSLFNNLNYSALDEVNFENNMFVNFVHLFQPKYKHKLDIVTEIYPDFQIIFRNMIKRHMGKSYNYANCSAMNKWYRSKPQLKDLKSVTLNQDKYYKISLWKSYFEVKNT